MRTIIIITVVLAILLVLVGVIYYLNLDDLIDEDQNNDTNESETTGNPCVELGCSADTIYVGSINSDKYYECRCSWAKNINPENIICFETDAEALAVGRTKSEC